MCIWAFVAQSKLDRILEELGEHLSVEYRVVPVFGSVPWRFRNGPWAADGVEGRIEATRRIAAEHGHPEVSGECWRIDAPASSWAPGAAIKAVCGLELDGQVEPGLGATYQVSLRQRFFVDNVNVARQTTQLELAEELDIPRNALEARLDDGTALAALWEDHLDKERLMIQGSPTYVFDGGRAKLYGNFAYGILHATVEELVRGVRPGASAC